MTRPSVLITGSSTGIGAATARVFSARGWNVAATLRRPADGAALAGLPGVRLFELDVTDKASVTSAVDAAVQAFGGLDVVVNNAGYGLFGPFETADEAVIRRQFETNVFGLFNVTRAALPALRASGAGVVINVSSVGGLTTFPMFSLYHATKFAVVGFSEALGYELAPLGVRVKMVAPGGVATDFAGRSMARTFGDEGPGIYAQTVEKTMQGFAARRGSYASSESLGEAIFAAATDGTPRTRYVVGQDAEDLLALRAKLGDEAFIEALRQRFGLPAP